MTEIKKEKAPEKKPGALQKTGKVLDNNRTLTGAAAGALIGTTVLPVIGTGVGALIGAGIGYMSKREKEHR